MKWLLYVLFALTVCAFVIGLVGGFVASVHADGVECGAPLEVIDGSYASGVPDSAKDACQSAANRWIGLSLIPPFAFFVPAFVIGLVLQRKGEFPGRRIR